MTSNIVTLTILPDDPNWDAERLSDVLRTLRDPSVVEEYKQLKQSGPHPGDVLQVGLASVYELSQTRLVQAQKALGVLDTEAGLRERVTVLPEAGGHGMVFPAPITATTQPALAYSLMHERAREPQFGIGINYALSWATVVAKRDHPENFRPSGVNGAAPTGGSEQDDEHRIAAEERIVEELQAVLPHKVGPAKSTTKNTLTLLKQELARQKTAQSKQ